MRFYYRIKYALANRRWRIREEELERAWRQVRSSNSTRGDLLAWKQFVA